MSKNKLKTGWLSPNGDLWECNTFNHISKADEIINKYHYPTINHRSSDEVLMFYGWVHISISQIDHKYRIWWDKFLTPNQINFLKQYFDETEQVSDLDRIKWDKEIS